MALYDPGQEPKVTDFTIADVLAWARTKPADERYNYCDSFKCAVAQFGRDTGRSHLIGIGDLRDDYRELYEVVNPSFYGPDRIEWDYSLTFAGLVKRLEALV